MEIDGNTIIFVVILLFFVFSNPSGDGVTSQYEFNQLQTLKDQIKTEYRQFRNMTYDSNFQNITGWKLSYQDALDDPNRNATYPIEGKDYISWDESQNYMVLPNEVITEINENVWNSEKGMYPPNITSTLHGHVHLKSNQFEKIPMPIPKFFEPPTDFSQIQPSDGEEYPEDWPQYGELHNVTFDKGEIMVQISHIDKISSDSGLNSKKGQLFNTQSDKWKLLHLQIDFYDKEEHEKHSFGAKAVYDIDKGKILAMSESAKYHSLFAFPHYINTKENDENEFKEVSTLINQYWNASDYVSTLTMAHLQDWYNSANYKCEYLAFLQLEPWKDFTPDQIKMIDDELNWPVGRPANLSHLPPINISSGLFYSPDCGVMLQFNNVKGPRYELQIRTIKRHLLFGISLFAAQIYLLLSQMHHTNTPSSVNKISFWCFSMMNFVDGSLAFLYFMASNVIKELYLPLIISAFACFILASIFETRYLISVYASQINERNVGIMTLLRGSTDEALPARTNTTIPDESSISSGFYGRFIFTLTISTFVILSSMSWPKDLRTTFEYCAITVLNSYWIPQIFRNVIKGNQPRRRRNMEDVQQQRQNKPPLLWKFIIGTTIIRIAPVIYVFTYSSNVFRHHKDVKFTVILCLWLFFQISILYSQDILGARWFLSKHAIPEGYSYHKSMTSADLLEHGCSSDYCIDCAICMTDVPIYVSDIEETHKVDINSYMVTPCGHIFHTQCLESWMSYKLQCPVCRAPLPPL